MGGLWFFCQAPVIGVCSGSFLLQKHFLCGERDRFLGCEKGRSLQLFACWQAVIPPGALWLELLLCHNCAHDKFTFFALQLDLISMEVVVQVVSVVFYLGFQSS